MRTLGQIGGARAMQAQPSLDPPDDDDELLTDDSALDLARDQLEQTPGMVACWLDAEARKVPLVPLDGYALAHVYRPLTPAEALVVLMYAPDTEALKALHQLREHYKLAMTGAAQALACDILAAQHRAAMKALEDDRAEAAADRWHERAECER